VILENYKKNQIWTNYDGEIHATKILLRIKNRNVVGDAGRINCSSFSNRTKEEVEGTAACRRRARFGGFDTQDGISGLVDGK
jgi:nicotinic acid phosphoribosyltransferase